MHLKQLMLCVTQRSLIAGGINLWFLEDHLEKGLSFDGLVVFTIWYSTVKWIKHFKTLNKLAIKGLNILHFRGDFIKLLVLGVHVVFKLHLEIFFTFNLIHLTLDAILENISQCVAQ